MTKIISILIVIVIIAFMSSAVFNTFTAGKEIIETRNTQFEQINDLF